MEKYENLNGREILNEYLKILEERCEDFKELRQTFIAMSKTFETYYKYADKVCTLHDILTLSTILFSFELGFIDNHNHFLNPDAPTFMDTDYDEAMREKEMRQTEVFIETTEILEDHIASMPQNAEDIYFEMLEYYTFLDTYIQKLAHYHGFTTANTELFKRILDYKPDNELTEKYKNWLSDYLGMNFD